MPYWNWGNLWTASMTFLTWALPLVALVWGFRIIALVLFWWVELAPVGKNVKTLGVVRLARQFRSLIWQGQMFTRLIGKYWKAKNNGSGFSGMAQAVRRAFNAVKVSNAGETNYDTVYGGPPDNLQSEARAEATPGLSDIDFVRRHG